MEVTKAELLAMAAQTAEGLELVLTKANSDRPGGYPRITAAIDSVRAARRLIENETKAEETS